MKRPSLVWLTAAFVAFFSQAGEVEISDGLHGTVSISNSLLDEAEEPSDAALGSVAVGDE